MTHSAARPGANAVGALVLALFGAVVVTGQQPVFRGGVDLVALDVTVVDKDGKPIKGLAGDDFVVTLEGQRRPVRVVDFEEFGVSSPSSASAAPPSQTTNQAPDAHQASRGGRIIVLLVDDLSTKAGRAKGLMVAAERMLASFDPDDLVGIATTSGLGTIVNPTRDRAALVAALKSKSLVGKYDDVAVPFYISIPEGIDIDRGFPEETLKLVTQRECAIVEMGEACPEMIRAAGRRVGQENVHRSAMQFAAYTAVIEALRSAPKPRIVLALSSGVPTTAENTTLDLEPVSRAAAEVGVQFYALTEDDDGVDLADGPARPCLPPCKSRAASRRDENNFLLAGMQTLASAAGGEAFRVVGQADRFFTRILAETSGVYRLGVEAPPLSDKRRLLNVKVSVNRNGATVRTNRHALVPSIAATPVSIDDALRARIAQGGVAFGVPIALATALRRDPSADRDHLQLAVNVQVPATITAPLTMMYSLIDAAGAVALAGRKSVPSPGAGEDYWIAFPVPLTAGSYHLRFAVADANGNVGSVDHVVVAHPARFGTITASDLFTSWIDAADVPRFLALETLPAAATSLHTSIELYADAGSAIDPALQVRFTLTRSGDATAIATRDVDVTETGGMLTAATDMATMDLAPGTYAIQATVLNGAGPIGTVSAVFRKAR